MIATRDIFGFSDDIERIAQRLADNGYPVLVPILRSAGTASPVCGENLVAQMGKGQAFNRVRRHWLLIRMKSP